MTETVASELRTRVRGEVIEPWHPDYNQARAVYNAAHDTYPAIIVRAVDASDVAAALRFARDHDLLLAVRGGGHSIAGFSTCDGGLVVDLSRMRDIRVDPQRRTARAGGGCTWGEFNHATHGYGLATTGGIVSSTGIAGLTLGGGFGFLMRRYGLTCDNLLSAEVVTADGTVLTCDERREPDLFWALRGGGGNFGVVTSFEYRLHPVGEILGGPTFFPLDGGVLGAYREMIADAPEALGAIAALALIPPAPFVAPEWRGRPGIALLTCWTGPAAEGERLIASFRDWAPVAGSMVGPMPYPAINTLFDQDLPAGLHHYWKGHFARGLPDDAVAAHLTFGASIPSPQSSTLFFPLNGATARVGPGDTAFAYRDATFAVALGPSWPDPADSAVNVDWCRRYAAAVAPWAEEGGYVNFASAEDHGRVAADYRGNYARLGAIKRRYDPGNLFRRNHNIAPA
jgi:FAD/FMN-containing dehydrogenase